MKYHRQIVGVEELDQLAVVREDQFFQHLGVAEQRSFIAQVLVDPYPIGQADLLEENAQGGLVKTLDFKIYLGLLTETYNDAHNDDIKRTGSVPIDMVIGNLYPFKDTISQPDVTVEQARGNIDIGGPCMIRASAKNYIRVASVVDPSDYESIVSEMKANHGYTSLELRFRLAQKAFEYTAIYDRTIADFLGSRAIEDVVECYEY